MPTYPLFIKLQIALLLAMFSVTSGLYFKCFLYISHTADHFSPVFCRSFENNLTTYRLLSNRKADSELPNVSVITTM